MYRSLLVTIACFLFVGSTFAGDQDSAKKQEANQTNQMPPFVALLLKGGTDNFIKHFDKNKDGVLTKDECPPGLAKIFDRVDTNHDGKLDKGEIERLHQMMRQRFGENNNKKPEPTPNKPANKNSPNNNPNNNPQIDRVVEKLLEQMDANKDGKISKAEAKGKLAEFFDQLDTNKDGYLDKEELRRAAARFVANQGGKGGPGGPGPGPQRRGPEFDDLDKNADGRLTRDELKGTPFAEHFDEIDTNKDGKIDRKEFEAYLKKQAAQKADKSADDSKSTKK
jgi:Ca2+-binding EF-hand superfamily protein